METSTVYCEGCCERCRGKKKSGLRLTGKTNPRGIFLNSCVRTVHSEYHSSKFDRGFVLLDIMLTGFNRLSSDDKLKGIEYVWHVCVLFTMGSVWGQNNTHGKG